MDIVSRNVKEKSESVAKRTRSNIKPSRKWKPTDLNQIYLPNFKLIRSQTSTSSHSGHGSTKIDTEKDPSPSREEQLDTKSEYLLMALDLRPVNSTIICRRPHQDMPSSISIPSQCLVQVELPKVQVMPSTSVVKSVPRKQAKPAVAAVRPSFDFEEVYKSSTYKDMGDYVRVTIKETCPYCKVTYDDYSKLYCHANCYFLHKGESLL